MHRGGHSTRTRSGRQGGLLSLAVLAVLLGSPPAAQPAPPECLAALTEGTAGTPAAARRRPRGRRRDGRHLELERSLRGAMSSRVGDAPGRAATLFLGGFQPASGGGSSVLATLLAGQESAAGCWTLLDTDQLQPFPEALRDGRIHDRQPLAKPSLADVQEAKLSQRAGKMGGSSGRSATARGSTLATRKHWPLPRSWCWPTTARPGPFSRPPGTT